MLPRAVVLLALLASHVRADETPPQPATRPEAAPAAAPDWSAAPRPDQASGIEQAEATPVREHLLWIPRAILFVPRWAVWGVGQPIRGGAYVYERYDLPGKFKRWFFNVDETFGVYPTATYETGFGITAGARLVHRDLFGDGERVKVRADWGGRYRQAYGVNLRSGERLPFGAIEIDASYERRPNEPYYGIGDAATDGETRFQEDILRAISRVEVSIAGALGVRVVNAIAYRELMDTRIDNTSVEGQLVYDSRRPTSIYAAQVIDATGWLAAVHTGVTRGIDNDVSEFTSYGVEVQRYFDLYRGTRVLALRVLVEAITGESASIVDLPRLGGTEFLRGYPNGRFRDNALTLATAEYTWDLGNFFAGYAFVDVGRVWPSLRDVALEDPRIGYGVGMQLHTTTSYIGRVQVAGSRDGDLVVELVLSPAFPRRERLGRY